MRDLSSRAQRGICFSFVIAAPLFAQHRVDVTPRANAIAIAVASSNAGDTVVVHRGRYTEPLIIIDKPLVLLGDGNPVLDGQGKHGLLLVKADDVTVRGFTLANVGSSYVDDRAAIRVEKARRCVIANNRLDDAFFGI